MANEYNFERARAQWVHVPVDAVGYIASTHMLAWPEDKLRATIVALEKERYGGWRNYKGHWRGYLGHDTTHGKHVLDFGCGCGVEALQFAKAGNRVTVADINEDSVKLAQRVLGLWGHESTGVVIDCKEPFVTCEPIDVFYASGVIHHLPYPIPVLRRAVELLRPGGEIRMMLYSDKAWSGVVQVPPPPVDMPIREHSAFRAFYQYFDYIGEYADWYNREKLEHFFGNFLDVKLCEPITEDEYFMAAVLTPKVPK